MFATFLTSKLLSLRPWPLFRLPGTKHGFVLDGMMVGILVGGFSWLPCFSQYRLEETDLRMDAIRNLRDFQGII